MLSKKIPTVGKSNCWMCLIRNRFAWIQHTSKQWQQHGWARRPPLCLNPCMIIRMISIVSMDNMNIHKYIYIDVIDNIYTHKYTYVDICMYIETYIYIYIFTIVYIYVYVHLYAYIYMYACTHAGGLVKRTTSGKYGGRHMSIKILYTCRHDLKRHINVSKNLCTYYMFLKILSDV